MRPICSNPMALNFSSNPLVPLFFSPPFFLSIFCFSPFPFLSCPLYFKYPSCLFSIASKFVFLNGREIRRLQYSSLSLFSSFAVFIISFKICSFICSFLAVFIYAMSIFTSLVNTWSPIFEVWLWSGHITRSPPSYVTFFSLIKSLMW